MEGKGMEWNERKSAGLTGEPWMRERENQAEKIKKRYLRTNPKKMGPTNLSPA